MQAAVVRENYVDSGASVCMGGGVRPLSDRRAWSLYSVDHGVHALETTYLVLPDSRWGNVYPHVQHVVLDQE